MSRATRPISHCVGQSVGHTFTFSMRMAFSAPAQLIIAPAQLIIAPAQLISAPTQLISAPTQPPTTGAAVYTALRPCCYSRGR